MVFCVLLSGCQYIQLADNPVPMSVVPNGQSSSPSQMTNTGIRKNSEEHQKLSYLLEDWF